MTHKLYFWEETEERGTNALSFAVRDLSLSLSSAPECTETSSLTSLSLSFLTNKKWIILFAERENAVRLLHATRAVLDKWQHSLLCFHRAIRINYW